MTWIHDILAGAGVGLVAGLASGFTGTSPGGGLVIFSVLLLGAEQHVAQGTSLITQIPPTGLAGARRYWQSGNRSPLQWIVWIGLGFLLGGTGGGYAAAAVSDAVLRWTYVVYLVALIAMLLLRSDRKETGSEADTKDPLHELVNELLLSPMGRRDWPMRFYSRERLLSVDARRNFVPPDIAALP